MNTGVPEDHEDLWRPFSPTSSAVFWFECVYVRDFDEDSEELFIFYNNIDKERIKKHFCSSGSSDKSGDTWHQTKSRLKVFRPGLRRSSGCSQVVMWSEKVAKTENLRSALCGISEFEENEKKCVYFLHNCLQFLRFVCIHNIHKQNYHTITPKSYNHTTIKPSYENHTKIIRT